MIRASGLIPTGNLYSLGLILYPARQRADSFRLTLPRHLRSLGRQRRSKFFLQLSAGPTTESRQRADAFPTGGCHEGWSDTSFTSTPITLMTTSSSGFPIGYALVTVFTNGIPSQSQFVLAHIHAITTSTRRKSDTNRTLTPTATATATSTPTATATFTPTPPHNSNGYSNGTATATPTATPTATTTATRGRRQRQDQCLHRGLVRPRSRRRCRLRCY